MDHVIGGKFKLGRKIGSGSFGELYLGICTVYFKMAFHLFCSELNLVLILSACFLKYVSGVNVQTGEEVAVKLVCVLFRIWDADFQFVFYALYFAVWDTDFQLVCESLISTRHWC